MVISIHAPRVGSDILVIQHPQLQIISIHAPRVGSDLRMSRHTPGLRYFNPRSPCGERPDGGCEILWLCIDFNPRSPCGERLAGLNSKTASRQFQSTLPVWGATKARDWSNRCLMISIHAPRVGSDTAVSASRKISINFNPRSPCGERPRA